MGPKRTSSNTFLSFDFGLCKRLNPSGWNVVASTSQVTPRVLGDPAGQEFITVTVLTESVTERYNAKPGDRTFVPIQTAPTTGQA